MKLLIFIFLAGVSVVLLTLSNNQKDKDTDTELVQHIQNNLQTFFTKPTDFSSSANPDTLKRYFTLARELKDVGIDHIALWDKNQTIIFSQKKEEAGKTYKDNNYIINAFLGEISVTQSSYTEYYIPIYIPEEEKPVGVLQAFVSM